MPPDPAAAERTGRHLGMLRELAELGMALARAAAQAALAEWNCSGAEATPPAAPSAPTLEAADRTAAGRPRPDPGLTFARLSRAVRQTIALEARIAAGDVGAAPRRRPDRRWTDPRLPAIRRILHEAAETDGDAHRDLRRAIDERLEDLAETDPGGDLPADEIIQSICDDLGISVDASSLPDELLEAALGNAPGSVRGAPELRHETPPRPSGPDPP